MPAYYSWTTDKKQKHKEVSHSFEVNVHPLKENTIQYVTNTSKSFCENLQKWSLPFEELDPLLRFEKMNLDEDNLPLEIDKPKKSCYQQSWHTKRIFILNKYTTGEKLTIVSSYLPGGEKTLIRQVSNLNEKVKHRLEQLDDFDESSIRKTMGLSQQEFVTKVLMLDGEIKKAWDSEQRVKAFKIAIQCSKLLSDVNVMQFYPSKFVLISDVLDNFGSLVFERLKHKSFGNKKLNFDDIDPNTVPELAKETCQNWIYKMASIRELLPRLYMEMALLPCYVFLSKEDIKSSIERLTKMIRGIGNPLVAVYIRLYLCNVASKLYQGCEKVFYDNLNEFIEDYQQVFHNTMLKKYGAQLLTADQYLNLYTPAVGWMLFGTVNLDTDKIALLDELLKKCEKLEHSELLLSCLVAAFDSPTIIQKSTKILEMISKNIDGMVIAHQVLSSLGSHLCSVKSYQQLSSDVLSETWLTLACKMNTTTANFLLVLEPWIEFACLQLSSQQINVILRVTIRVMIKSKQPADQYSTQIQSVLKRMLKNIPDVEELFLMDAFMPLVELPQTSHSKTMMAKTVLSIFFERYKLLHIDDPIVLADLMRLCRILHDSINAVTVEDESKVCADLINKLVVMCYCDALEEQLGFYVECRGAFIKLDSVLVTLVHAVNALASRAMSKECAAPGGPAVRACAAYCFITVPSLSCAFTRASLYLLSGQVALRNNCIGQAEANFKALVSMIPEIPEYIHEDGQRKPSHERILGLISNLLSTLLVLPDNVDSNTKAYILSGLIKVMERVFWSKTEQLYYSTLLRILDVLCEMTQENYAYHINTVISNDELYGSDEEFIKSMESHATNICQELLVVLKALGDAKETKKQYNLALELFWRIIRRGDLEQTPMLILANKLWMLSQKLQESDGKCARSMLSALQDSAPRRHLLEILNENMI
ncbi:VPS35 endosomal protein-sorting factor-like isoform X2 [Leptidea sinapis]|uniref:VPS35 endosomal protein-sorting factor-like isoform X2 n=1 Tax=Leptidea sinapis TaxID=189913 RepID=UPI002125C695|nr:VPS35 endosomal protein-sorting factor-like isoform X2 [Leptidea sinapis]